MDSPFRKLVFGCALAAVSCASSAPPGGADGGGPSTAAGASSASAGAGPGAGGSAQSSAGASAVGSTGGGSTGGFAGAGAPVAGAPSAGAGSAGSPGCPFAFCEGFEQGALDAEKWKQQTLGGATVNVQSVLVAHGQFAAQFHALATPTGASNAYAYLIAKVPEPLRVHHFGRAYFQITPAAKSNNIGLVYAGTTGFPKPTYLSVAEHSGGFQLGFIALSGSPSGERQAYSAGKMQAQRWLCLEWEFDDQPDQIHVFTDGTLAASFDDRHIDYPSGHVPGDPIFDGKSSGLVAGFAELGIGIYDWHPGAFEYDVYYDDIAIDSQRVGCL